jgi:hypothetical protein
MQTALLALQAHPRLKQTGVFVLRSAREIKNVASFDSVGKAVGRAIEKRARKKLGDVMNPADVNELEGVINPYDAVSTWWTSAMKEDIDDLHGRFFELFNTLLWYEFDSALLVGHSLLFREFIKRCLETNPESEIHKDRTLVHNLCKRKIGNTACLMLELDFSHPACLFDKNARAPSITHAHFLFGTSFEGSELEEVIRKGSNVWRARDKPQKPPIPPFFGFSEGRETRSRSESRLKLKIVPGER